MPRLKQEPLSNCALVTCASIKVASHTESQIQWLGKSDLIWIALPFFLSFFLLLFLALCPI